MFKKFSTTTLIIIIVLLGALVAFDKLYLEKKSESTFSDQFVKIDSAAVKQISIYPKAEKGKEIKIIKGAKGWELQNDKVKTVPDSMSVVGLIKSFADIKSNALVATDKSGWEEYKVDDTSGTRIKFTMADGKTYDMIVGKFGYNQATRSGTTYIRHADDENVYAIDGFLSMSVNRPFSSWRNRTFISGDNHNWNKLTFSYLAGNSFVLERSGNTWLVNGQPADSAKVIQYLNRLSHMSNGNFADQYTPSSTPVYSLTIEGNNQPAPITVVAYPADSIQKFILHSSLNNDAYFSDKGSNITQQVFVGSDSFLKEEK